MPKLHYTLFVYKISVLHLSLSRTHIQTQTFKHNHRHIIDSADRTNILLIHFPEADFHELEGTLRHRLLLKQSSASAKLCWVCLSLIPSPSMELQNSIPEKISVNVCVWDEPGTLPAEEHYSNEQNERGPKTNRESVCVGDKDGTFTSITAS